MQNEKTKYFVICALIVLATSAAFYWRTMWFSMPGQTFKGVLPPLFEEEKAVQRGLDEYINYFAKTIGERNAQKYDQLQRAGDHIVAEFAKIGYKPQIQEYEWKGKKFRNIEVVIPGKHPEQGAIIFGADYDSPAGSVGADDNASGIAALLTLSEMFYGRLKNERTIKFVAFATSNSFDDDPDSIGASKYLARPETANEKLKGFVSLENIGCYSDETGSEKLPEAIASFYPVEGNFLMFVADAHAARLCRDMIQGFRTRHTFPSEGIICQNERNPDGIPGTDHYAFWKAKIPAVLLTDTGSCRIAPGGNTKDDIGRVNTERLTRVVSNLSLVLDDLANN